MGIRVVVRVMKSLSIGIGVGVSVSNSPSVDCVVRVLVLLVGNMAEYLGFSVIWFLEDAASKKRDFFLFRALRRLP